MRPLLIIVSILLSFPAWSDLSLSSRKQAGYADEPIIGGPCEGCELVFIGLPENLATRVRIGPLDEPGEPMVIEGTVRTLDGNLADGIIVYAYQTDYQGTYPVAATRHGRLRGWAKTDENGYYRFKTIRPGTYPSRDLPQHVHMHVIEPGVGTYFIDDILFSDDPLLTSERLNQLQEGRGGDGLANPEKESGVGWKVRRDITLGLNIPGYQ
jgi:protocatechuate 3,4-dioxygenase beta subunit